MAAAGGNLIWARHARALVRPCGARQKSVSIRASAVAVEAVVPAAPAVGPAFKANLDFKFVKENLALVTDNCKARSASADPARVAQLYDEFTRLKQESDRLRASRNENSAAMKVG
jgi:seryl-tRNA synthetase